MKIWTLTVEIETEDSYSAKEVLKKIDQDVNRGDGIYIKVKDKETRIKLVKKMSDYGN
jgi:hypothetical protein